MFCANRSAHDAIDPTADDVRDDVVIWLSGGEGAIHNELPSRAIEDEVEQHLLKRHDHRTNSFVTVPLREIWSIGNFCHRERYLSERCTTVPLFS